MKMVIEILHDEDVVKNLNTYTGKYKFDLLFEGELLQHHLIMTHLIHLN